jgi:hypothetical protein
VVEGSGWLLLLAIVVALDGSVVVLVVAVVVEEVLAFGVVTELPDGVVLGGLSHSGCK